MDDRFTRLARDELFDRLQAGRAAPITVLTPNRRLSDALTADFDARQLGARRATWEAPDILPWDDFLERCHDEAAHSDAAADVPALLTDAQEQWLWEEAIRAGAWRERLLAIPATASLAASAWRLVHAWRIEGALDGWPGNEDSEAFRAWRAHYLRRTARERLTDRARLAGVVGALLARGAVPVPPVLVLYGFDLVTPQQREALQAFAAAGATPLAAGPEAIEATVRRAELASPREELEHAARWARSRLEHRAAGRTRIAVVVPDLATRRAEVARVFARVLPGGLFNVSLGQPLEATPLAHAALGLLALCGGPVPFERASRLLRSPFLAGAESELTARAALDAALRRTAPPSVTLPRLRGAIAEAIARRSAPDCPRLLAALDALIVACASPGRAAPHEWARRFTAWLAAAGFPGERTLDSAEFQALAKWREALASLGSLSTVASSWSAGEARARLQRLCGETLFQPASGDAPVQVLGVLESSRLEFDHLWVSGLTEEAWPVPARAHPLVPPALQRKAGVPQASPERSLELDRAFTQAWRAAAPEVVFSSARADGDRELLASPLIASLPATPVPELAIPRYATRRDALFEAGQRAGAMASVPEGAGPRVAQAAVHGGTALLADQAACPFRAFARWRLDAAAPERPEAGLTAAERGQLVHALMADLWERLRDHRTLVSAPPGTLATHVEAAAAHAVARLRAERPGRLEGEMAALERERLGALAREWLALERERAPFEVVATEERAMLAAGPLALRGRVDRVDRLEGGGLAVLDYKTGPASVGEWFGERPGDLQLPLYALAREEPVDAVAFARLKAGQLGFAGVTREPDVLPRVASLEAHRTARGEAASWPALLEGWRRAADALGEAFAGGQAGIDPRDGLATCGRCEMQPLCRVHERFGALEGEAAGEERE